MVAASSAWGHVTVSPAEAPAGLVQRYCIRVPAEKSIPTVAVEVQFPLVLEVTQIEAPAGWRVEPVKGRDGRIVSATWRSGRITPQRFTEFGVVARNPATRSELIWKAIQTYEDGSEVHWIGPPRAQFPAAITHVGASKPKESACAAGTTPSQQH